MTQVFVGNLAFSINDEELQEMFSSIGNIVKAEIIMTAQGKSRGFGIVSYESTDIAMAAIETFNETEWSGRQIQVKLDKVKTCRKIELQAAQEINTKGLYVGNLAFSATRESLQELLKEAGGVERVEIPLDYQKRSKGYAIVVMATLEDARQAQTMFHGFEWHGRQMQVRPDKNFQEKQARQASPELQENQESTEGCALFVGNLPFSVQWQELKDLFKTIGNVARCDVTLDSQGRSKGFGQVLMSTVEEANEAIASLNEHELDGRSITVRIDNRNSSPANFVPGSQVFVGNLPFNLRWQDLKDLFRGEFDPVHATVSVDSSTHRSKGFGVVRFASADEAERAVEEMNGAVVSGRTLTVRIDKLTEEVEQ